MPAEFVQAFNIRNKNDAADARAIWLAVQQPSKPVAVKTEMQQAMLALHRMREQLVKFRTMQMNGLRGLLTEYGEVMSKGTGKAGQGNTVRARSNRGALACRTDRHIARAMERIGEA
ncbi:MAG: hypothetical protein E5299_01308 [Burkholderia gladioli]|nr:MAG: hypothetical protein E5299_01308 [Burkholderia gladioli]